MPTSKQDATRADAEARGLTRRNFITRTTATVGTLSLGGIAAACGGGGGGSSAASTGGASAGAAKVGGTVVYLGWQGYDDKKAAKPVLSKGVKLATTYVSNNDEIISKLRGGALGSVDIVTPYFGYIKPMVDAGMLQPIDYTRLTNAGGLLKQFDKPDWNTFDGKTYSVPVVWGDGPFIYDAGALEPPSSWLDLRDSKYKGKLVTLDDALSNILIMSLAVNQGLDNPTRITKTQLTDVMRVWGEIKPNLVTIAPSYGDIGDLLSRGDVTACVAGWRFLIEQLAEKHKKLSAHTPKEGSYAWCDNYCIPKDAPNADAAYAVIDTMVSAAGDAQIGAATGSAVVNGDAIAKLPASQKKLYPYASIDAYFQQVRLYGLPPLEPEGDLATLKDWQAAWTAFKA